MQYERHILFDLGGGQSFIDDLQFPEPIEISDYANLGVVEIYFYKNILEMIPGSWWRQTGGYWGTIDVIDFQLRTATAVPEPATLGMFGVGLLLCALGCRRSREPVPRALD